MRKIYAMVCLILDEKRKVLLLKRDLSKKFFPGKWAPVAAAPLRKNTNMGEIALREIKDELGVEGKIIKRGGDIDIKTGGTNWVIAPFLASIKSKEIILNKEHTEARWVPLEELGKYDLVPGLEEAVRKVL